MVALIFIATAKPQGHHLLQNFLPEDKRLRLFWSSAWFALSNVQHLPFDMSILIVLSFPWMVVF